MRVQNMTGRTGREVANQFILHDEGGATYFQSYNSIIVKRANGRVYLDQQYWDYSVTTGKYRNQFLGETKQETERKIRSGEYELVNLN